MIDYVKKRINTKNLNLQDINLLLQKYETLGKWINVDLLTVDIKSNFDDVKQLIFECRNKVFYKLLKLL